MEENTTQSTVEFEVEERPQRRREWSGWLRSIVLPLLIVAAIVAGLWYFENQGSSSSVVGTGEFGTVALPAAKNIGTTHISNGCYRLHPVEWNIGEAAGLLAAFCLERDHLPRQVREREKLTREFQQLLRAQGIELEWPAVHPV